MSDKHDGQPISIPEQKDDEVTSVISKDWSITVPVKIRQKLPPSWQPGKEVVLWLGYGPKVLFELRAGVTNREKVESVRHELAILITLATIAIIATLPAAYAQTEGVEPEQQPATDPATPTPSDPIPIPVVDPLANTTTIIDFSKVQVEEFSGPSAYYPFKIFITYPLGITNPSVVNAPDPAVVYTLNTEVNSGVATTTFTTSVASQFEVLFGQEYSAPVVDQVATYNIFANEQRVGGGTIHITGTNFYKMFKFTTSPAPHIPTPEEIAKPITDRLDRNYDLQVKTDSKVDGIYTTQYLSSNALYSTVGINGIVILIGIATLAITIGVRQTIKHHNASNFKINRDGRPTDSSGPAKITLFKKNPERKLQQDQRQEQDQFSIPPGWVQVSNIPTYCKVGGQKNVEYDYDKMMEEFAKQPMVVSQRQRSIFDGISSPFGGDHN